MQIRSGKLGKAFFSWLHPENLRSSASQSFIFLFREREEVGAMDRESDMAEGDMGMFASGANIRPPLRRRPRGNGKGPVESRNEEIRKGAKKHESPQSQ
jgi:hypothetical protein